MGASLPFLDPAACWADAVLAIELFSVDPHALGGLVLRAGPGPQRTQVADWVTQLQPAGAPVLRLPLHVTDDRLLGGLSLAATLHLGQLVAERGVLARAHGGVVVLPMAERVEAHVVAHLCAALDRGELAVERDGLTQAHPARFGVLALDEGIADERVPRPLLERAALWVDFTALDPRSTSERAPSAERVAAARARAAQVTVGLPIIEALCQAGEVLGVQSLRGPLLACVVARLHAALEGRAEATEEDAALAARLVLGPRATRVPQPEPDEDDAPPPDDEPDEPPDEDEANALSDAPLDEVVLEAAKSGIPPGLLELLSLGRGPRVGPKSAGKSGAVRASLQGGRPAGSRAGLPRDGERLNVVETLRAAAPWQPLRRRDARGALGRGGHRHRVEVRTDDFRTRRYKQRTETSVIFCVDASGSAALQRLAEAKGAVEQVLVDCYVRRDHVALVAFRGTKATLLLPPTRSLARARKCLAELAGGGTTPLASGIDAALGLALDARRAGKTPVLVLMTDGRGNISRAGLEGGAQATEDALASARLVRGAGVQALFLDTAPRPRPASRALAEAMGARYLPLPYLDSKGISKQVQALTEREG